VNTKNNYHIDLCQASTTRKVASAVLLKKLWVAETDSSGIVYLMISNYINKYFNDFYF